MNIFFIILILLLLLLIFFVQLYPQNTLDSMAVLWASEHQSEIWTAFAKFLSFVGGLPGTVFAFIVLIYFCWHWQWRQGLRWFSYSFVFTAITTWLMKVGFDRARPTWHAEGLNTYGASFPSGHSAYAMLLSWLLILLLHYRCKRKNQLQQNLAVAEIKVDIKHISVVHYLTLLWAFLMGWSRIYIGAHFPTDVLLGWGVAILIVWSVVRFL